MGGAPKHLMEAGSPHSGKGGEKKRGKWGERGERTDIEDSRRMLVEIDGTLVGNRDLSRGGGVCWILPSAEISRESKLKINEKCRKNTPHTRKRSITIRDPWG